MTTLSVIVVGTGGVAKNFIKTLQKRGSDILAVVSSSAERAKSFGSEYGLPGYASVTEACEAHPSANLALVLNSNHQHAPDTIAALDKGLHVFCEKPMAPTMEECEAMVAAEKRSSGTLQIGFEYIHSTMPRRLRELQQDGFFGDLLSLSCVDSRGHWWSGNPNAPFADQKKLRRELGGGIIFHCGIHQLDMLRAYMGDFQKVRAYRSKQNALPYYPEDVPAHVQVMLETDDGRVASLEVFHSRAPTYYRRQPDYNPRWPDVPGHEFRLSLIGTQGSALADFYGEKLHLFRFNHEIKDTELERTEDFGFHPMNELHHDMTGFLQTYLARIEQGQGPIVPAEDALQTMRLAFATEASIGTGETVPV
ncbi:MAG: Gfo/Idh/MocA family oxidoreductase [Opitutales bacterium]|nr:Gfo/Idh/MocA family oxidoreductase [Opitutales bacterium]